MKRLIPVNIVLHHDTKDLDHSLIEPQCNIQLSLSFSLFFGEKLNSNIFKCNSKLKNALEILSVEIDSAWESLIGNQGSWGAEAGKAKSHLLGVHAAGGWIQSDF